MRCNDAAEFVSALCDGETIPPKAAEHIGHCSTCRVRLQGYLELGAELRRVSSLEPLSEVTSRRWMNDRQTPGWWTKGRESMRIPRFAFALLLLVIVALGSSLVLVRATPKSDLVYLGAAYPVTPLFILDGELAQLKFMDSANKARLFALRGTYLFSKRTALYATAGHIANDGTLALSASGAAAGGNPAAGTSQLGFATGIRHSF